ncbi:MAG: hypothetical protein K0R59_44 [Sphingobacterium sp.]|nr:hypothetical protein [Sphingobacterium sp.]
MNLNGTFHDKKNIRATFLAFFIFCIYLLSACETKERGGDRAVMFAFLKQNGNDLYSNVSVFFDTSGRQYKIAMDSIADESQLLAMIKQHNLLFSYHRVPDNQLPDSVLHARIEAALKLKKQNIWQHEIPDSIFLNYLLPHKVLYEEYGDWQTYFSRHYGSLLSYLPQQKLTKMQIDSLIETHVIRLDTGHLFTGRTSPLRMSKWPGMNELRIAKSGDCQSESIKNVYLYRSLGIPATMDFTPFYGGGNAGHSSAVSWDSQAQRLVPKGGQGFNTYYRVAKVFRWSFKKTNQWAKDILPFIKNKSTFPIGDLRNDHWFDVTAEHVPTKDIQIDIPGTSTALAFICTYTYGRWRPINYGRRLKSGKYLFKKMGKDILYRGAYMIGDSLVLNKEIIHLQKDGTVVQINKIQKSHERYFDLKMSKINYGNEAWIKKHGNYSLLTLNPMGSWDTLARKAAVQDSLLTFRRVPARKVYLLKNNAAKKDLERPFVMQKDSIIWY